MNKSVLAAELSPDHQAFISDLCKAHPRFSSYTFNRYGAPLLDGTSFFDMGLYLMIVELLGDQSNSTNLSDLLSVTKLTCKNWIGKHNQDTMAKIEWSLGREPGSRRSYKVLSWGIYQKSYYEPFAPFLRAVIDNWIKQRHDQRTTKPAARLRDPR